MIFLSISKKNSDLQSDRGAMGFSDVKEAPASSCIRWFVCPGSHMIFCSISIDIMDIVSQDVKVFVNGLVGNVTTKWIHQCLQDFGLTSLKSADAAFGTIPRVKFYRFKNGLIDKNFVFNEQSRFTPKKPVHLSKLKNKMLIGLDVLVPGKVVV